MGFTYSAPSKEWRISPIMCRLSKFNSVAVKDACAILRMYECIDSLLGAQILSIFVPIQAICRSIFPSAPATEPRLYRTMDCMYLFTCLVVKKCVKIVPSRNGCDSIPGQVASCSRLPWQISLYSASQSCITCTISVQSLAYCQMPACC